MKKKRILFGCFIATLSLSISACDLLPENLFNNANKKSSEETSQRSSKSGKSSSSKTSNHVHTFSEDWEYNENTHWHPATCGHSVKSEISPHDYYSVTTQRATCIQEGEAVDICMVCDYRQTRTIPLADHTWVIYDRKEPTCEEPGLYKKTCSYCGKSVEEYVEPLSHSFATRSYVPSTCTTPGSVCEVCTRCGYETTYELPTSPPWSGISGCAWARKHESSSWNSSTSLRNRARATFPLSVSPRPRSIGSSISCLSRVEKHSF